MIIRWAELFCNQIEVIISTGGKTAEGRDCHGVISHFLIISVAQCFSNLFLALEYVSPPL